MTKLRRGECPGAIEAGTVKLVGGSQGRHIARSKDLGVEQ